MRKVISNTSCLIVLSNIGKLDLLKDVYGVIFITEEVAQEFGDFIPEWINVTAVKDQTKTKLITKTLDIGEASTIALAMEHDDTLVILDDKKARRYAKGIDITFTGSLGVIVKAKQIGLSVDIGEILSDFKRLNFRMPPDIERILMEYDK